MRIWRMACAVSSKILNPEPPTTVATVHTVQVAPARDEEGALESQHTPSTLQLRNFTRKPTKKPQQRAFY